jgi:hypothetical protein
MNRLTDLTTRLARGEYEIDPGRVAEAMLNEPRGLLVLVPAGVKRPAFGVAQDDARPALGAA